MANRPATLGSYRSPDYTGWRFGMFRVTRIAPEMKKARSTIWEVLCDCGVTTYRETYDLKSGRSWNCGCRPRLKRDEPARYRERSSEPPVTMSDAEIEYARAVSCKPPSRRQLTDIELLELRRRNGL